MNLNDKIKLLPVVVIVAIILGSGYLLIKDDVSSVGASSPIQAIVE